MKIKEKNLNRAKTFLARLAPGEKVEMGDKLLTYEESGEVFARKISP